MNSRRHFGSVRKLPSGRYQASYWHEGRRHSGPNTFAAKADARAFLSHVETDIYRGAWLDPRAGKLSLAEYSQKWLNERVNLRPRTVELYQRQLEHDILPSLGVKAIAEISPSAVRIWNADLAARRSSTAAKAYRLLSTIMKTAVDDELILRSPCRVKGAGIEHAGERPIVTMAEAGALAEAMPERMRAVVLLGAWCALRRGEILALRRKDVDLLHRHVRIERTAHHFTNGLVTYGPPKTAAGIRNVSYPPNIGGAIVTHLETFVAPAPDSLLFTGEMGGALRPHVLGAAWNRARQSLGRPELRFHDLRHSGATWSAIADATTKELMRRLGHASPAAALRYQHATQERDAEIAKAMAKLSAKAKVVPIRKADIVDPGVN